MKMRTKTEWTAGLLLVIFAVGGLLSPVAHRISHVHNVEHQHGEAATHFSERHVQISGEGFYVEERTPPHDLACDLCARLSLVAYESVASSSNPLDLSSVVKPTDRFRAGLTHVFSPIRAPPAIS